MRSKKSIKMGKKYGQLTTVREVYSIKGERYRKVLCECECGNMIIVKISDLKNGNTQSCGCLSKEGSNDS